MKGPDFLIVEVTFIFIFVYNMNCGTLVLDNHLHGSTHVLDGGDLSRDGNKSEALLLARLSRVLDTADTGRVALRDRDSGTVVVVSIARAARLRRSGDVEHEVADTRSLERRSDVGRRCVERERNEANAR